MKSSLPKSFSVYGNYHGLCQATLAVSSGQVTIHANYPKFGPSRENRHRPIIMKEHYQNAENKHKYSGRGCM